MLDLAIIARLYALISGIILAFAGSALGSTSAFATDAFPGTTIAGNSGSFTDSNTGATGQVGEPTTFGGGTLNTIWYSWTAPASGVVVAGTCNPTASTTTNFDTTLGVYTGNAVNALTAITTNDDTTGCNSTVNANYGSTVTFMATAGTTYRLQVDGYTNATGNYHFHYGLVGMTVATSDGSATEGGDTGAFTVRLTTVPTANVTVTIGTSTQCTFAASTLTFTLANWNTPQTVTATAINDAVVEGIHSCAPASITATGGSFATATGTPPTISINDNDVGTLVATTTDNAATETAGNTGAFTVALGLQPSASVTVTIGASSQCNFATSPLTFTTANWNTAQTITVTPIDDAVVEGPHSCSPASITAAGGGYTGVAGTPPTINITDNDVASFTIVKAVNTANISAPATLTYTITIANTGNIPLTTPVITDSLSQGGALTLTTGPTLASGDAAPLGTLNVGETWVYTATYQVTQANINTGTTISNVSTFDTLETAPSTSNTVTTVITQSPAMTVVKTASTAGPVSAGAVITYTFTVKNTGNVTLSNIVLADIHNGYGTPPTPSNETLLSDVAPLGDSTDLTPNNGTWTTLAPGDSLNFTAPYTVIQQDVDLLQ